MKNKSIIIATVVFILAFSCKKNENSEEVILLSTQTSKQLTLQLSSDEDLKQFYSKFKEIDLIIQKQFNNKSDKQISNILDNYDKVSKNITTKDDLYKAASTLGLNTNETHLFVDFFIQQGERIKRVQNKFPKLLEMDSFEQKKIITNASNIFLSKHKLKVDCESYANCVDDAQSTAFWEGIGCVATGPLYLACFGVVSAYYIYSHYVCEKRHNSDHSCVPQ